MVFCRQVEGKEAPGPLFDFGLLMFHCGKALFEQKSGPFFYLSKVTRANLHMFKYADDFIYLGLHCYPLFCRWRAIWRPGFGTKYLFGHSRRFALFFVFMYKLVFVVCLVFLACRATVHWPYKH